MFAGLKSLSHGILQSLGGFAAIVEGHRPHFVADAKPGERATVLWFCPPSSAGNAARTARAHPSL